MIMETASKVLHIYRRLLRAATYVPDSFARNYVHGFIVSRFKANRNRANLTKPNAKALAANRLKKARRWSAILENAAQGSVEDLQKLLIHVHGRQGARKRVLIRQLIQPDENKLPRDDEALEELIHKDISESTLKIEPGTKLHALSRSQQQHHLVGHNKSKPRHLEPNIPEENIWGRPTPRKLTQSLRKKWWADTIDRLLPPVSLSEWERLRDFATGAKPLEKAPPRRVKGAVTILHQDRGVTGEHLLNALRSPARLSRLGVKKLEFEASHGLIARDTKDPLPSILPSSRARSMRRMYASIWILTPTMILDEVTQKWLVRWGGQKSRALEGAVSQPSAHHMELFEGVDNLGDSTRPISRHKLKKERRLARLSAAEA